MCVCLDSKNCVTIYILNTLSATQYRKREKNICPLGFVCFFFYFFLIFNLLMHNHLYQIFGIITVSFACGKAQSWMLAHKNMPGDDSGYKQSWTEDCNQKI